MTQAIAPFASDVQGTGATRSRGALAEIARQRRELIEAGESGAIPAFDAPIPRAKPPVAQAESPGHSPSRESTSERTASGAREREGGEAPRADASISQPAPRTGEGGRVGPIPLIGGPSLADLPEGAAPEPVPASSHRGPAIAGRSGSSVEALLTRLGASSSRVTGSGVASGRSGGAPGVIVGSARAASAVRPTYQRSAPAGPRLERDALIEQIQRGLAQALRQGGGELTIRLRPEHLGLVRVRVSVQREQVTAAIQASSVRARDLLGSDLRTLRDALEARGLSVDRIVVEHDEQAAPERESLGERDATPGDGGASGRGRSPDRDGPDAERSDGTRTTPTVRVESRPWDGRVDTLA